ncbi:HYDIN protein, partial [Chaetorhynchus papuensis]|nr:HYDIN protein [Chaetorhynchus papuensis]
QDYFHQLMCVTEREKFVVPIRAIGARAILDFPDQLDFSECPVKHSSKKTLLVRNSGNRAVGYQLRTQSPFSATPAVGTVGIDEAVQVTVGFQPLKSGDYSASLTPLCFVPGENTHTSLHGTAVDAHIRLDRNDVTFTKTYITLSDRTTVHILNASEITARFQWKALDPQEEQDQSLNLRVDNTHQEHSALLTRSLQSESTKVPGDPMTLNNDIFSLEPKEGQIRPNCSAEIILFFKPQAARVYKQAVYCDISGRENGLLLHLEGEGLGPQLHFKFQELDIGKVSVRAAHRFEAILVNKGLIEAPFSLIPPTTATGGCFTFLPQEGIVAPGGLQVIQMSFCPTVLGEFKE